MELSLNEYYMRHQANNDGMTNGPVSAKRVVEQSQSDLLYCWAVSPMEVVPPPINYSPKFTLNLYNVYNELSLENCSILSKTDYKTIMCIFLR